MSTGPVAQWIRHWPTEPGIAASSPAGVMLRVAHIAVKKKSGCIMLKVVHIAVKKKSGCIK